MSFSMHSDSGTVILPAWIMEKCMQAFEVELDQEYIALNDLLKITGVVDTGGAGKLMVASGVVQVDGQQELRKTCKIRPGQVVEVDGEVRITVLQMPPEE